MRLLAHHCFEMRIAGAVIDEHPLALAGGPRDIAALDGHVERPAIFRRRAADLRGPVIVIEFRKYGEEIIGKIENIRELLKLFTAVAVDYLIDAPHHGRFGFHKRFFGDVAPGLNAGYGRDPWRREES